MSEAIQDGTNIPPAITGGSYNNLNQLTNLSGTSGQMLFAGALDKPGTVSVNGVPARVNPHTTNFTGYATVSPGTNVVQVVAADSYGNSRTNRYQIVLTNNGVAQAITYDLNGNQVSSVTSFSTNTYEWDGADRLTAINSGTNRSEFTYDGLGRRVQIVEKQNGAVVSTKKFVWVGMAMSEERDSTGATVTKRFFGQGQVNGTTNLYYARDHLGTVREMTDGTGVLRARYDYDPYGRRTKLAGDLDADFAFTGHYFHAVSGLYLAPYRAYDANAARWLSRDPMRENAGLNLYPYVLNNPVNALDPSGLDILDWLSNHAAESYQNGGIFGNTEGILANALEAGLDVLGADTVKSLATRAGCASGVGQQGTAATYTLATVGLIAISAIPGAGKGVALVGEQAVRLISREAAVSLVKSTVVMGIVKDGAVVAVADTFTGLSHAEIAQKIGIALVKGKLPQGVEGFVANAAGSIIGGGLNNLGGYPVISALAEATVRAFFKF